MHRLLFVPNRAGRILLLALSLTLLLPFTLLAQDGTPVPDQITPEWLIQVLTPLVAFLAAFLIRKYITPNIDGLWFVGLIVPALTAALGWLGTLLSPESPFLTQWLIGLVAVFVRELIAQFQKKTTGVSKV